GSLGTSSSSSCSSSSSSPQGSPTTRINLGPPCPSQAFMILLFLLSLFFLSISFLSCGVIFAIFRELSAFGIICRSLGSSTSFWYTISLVQCI
ncbi:hypothetical protein PENTCL1PPCAC_13923, partial [Pristionchus entomophagus]